MKTNEANRFYTIAGLIVIYLIIFTVYLYPGKFVAIDGDFTYHLATAQSFVKNGGLGLHETWDSLPLGRPHLYPPVIHFFVAVLVALKLAPFTVIKIMSLLGISILMFLSWFSIKKIFGSRVALYYILVASSYVTFLYILGVTLPASTVLLLSPFLLILIRKRRVVAALLLLTILFYTHMVFPWFIVAALIIWAFFNHHYLKDTFLVVGIAFALYIPWLIHIATNLEYLRYFDPSYPVIIALTISHSFSVSLVLLFIISAFFLIAKWKKNLVQNDITFFLALAIVSLPVAYFEFPRYFFSIGILPMMVVIAYFVATRETLLPSFYKKNTSTIILFLFVISLFFSAEVSILDGKASWSIRHHLLLEGSFPHSPYYLGLTLSDHFTEANFRIGDEIQATTTPDQVILSLAHHLDTEEYYQHRTYVLPQLFAALSNRSMANLRSPEFIWQKGLDIPKATILMVNADQIDRDGTLVGRKDIDLKNDYTFIDKATGGLYVYKNKNPQPFTLPTSLIVLPLWLGWILLLGAFSYIGYCVFGRRTDSI